MTAAADEKDVLETVLQIVLKHTEGVAIGTGKVAAMVAELTALVSPPPAAPRARKVPAPVVAEEAPAYEPHAWPKRLGPSLPGKHDNEPAVPIDQSVFADAIICLEDGLPKKLLRRWLMSEYGLTPDQYRARWGLPKDYPLIAPDLRKKKVTIAKDQGFGVQHWTKAKGGSKPKKARRTGPRKPKA